MRYLTLACDYDGTIANEGVVAPTTLTALVQWKTSGRTLILVTGRELHDLILVFPEHAIFERIVAENGALLYSPGNLATKIFAEPPPQQFVDALRKLGVSPLSVGRSIVATKEYNDHIVLGVIEKLGLDLQMIYNKDSVMVLPSGVDKGSGLLAALTDLGLRAENTVGVGDGENDRALFSQSALRVAVTNAVSILKEHANLMTTQPNGKGVEELIKNLLAGDLHDTPSQRLR
jgi:hydroxymethylpyrimidine pyrophosphatase-like HAD family hydrolase